MAFNCLKATATSRRQFTFYHSVPRNSWYSFYRPRKDERLSRPWSHPVVLNTGPLDWESSTLTTRPILWSTLSYRKLLPTFIPRLINQTNSTFFHLVTFTDSRHILDAMLQALILCLSFFYMLCVAYIYYTKPKV